MDISIFGLGYVGCVSLGCLAQNGHRVIGVDICSSKVDAINNGNSPIIEGEIVEIIASEKKKERISATIDGVKAVRESDVSFICVGTPPGQNGHTDIGAVLKVAEEMGKGISGKEAFHTVVIRSTVPPGTNKKVSRIIENVSGKKKDADFAVVSNPEFMREGTAVRDYYDPPFTIIGTTSDKAIKIMRQIYLPIKAPFIVTDIRAAEMIKYVNNAFHALKITFANEIGNICKKLDIDSHKLMEIFCMDSKLNLSPYYLKPGFAYGGSCLPKDLKALRTIAHDLYVECPVLENIERSNEIQKNILLRDILTFGKKRVGFLGLSFKAGTDDLRNSPIVDVIEQLIGKGFEVAIYDKYVSLSKLIGANKEYILGKLPLISKFLVDDPEQLFENSEIVVVVNREKEYEDILEKIRNEAIIYDLIGISFGIRNRLDKYIGISW